MFLFRLRKSMKEQVGSVRSKRENSSEEKQKPFCQKNFNYIFTARFLGKDFPQERKKII